MGPIAVPEMVVVRSTSFRGVVPKEGLAESTAESVGPAGGGGGGGGGGGTGAGGGGTGAGGGGTGAGGGGGGGDGINETIIGTVLSKERPWRVTFPLAIYVFAAG